jgi:hypothetical protein
MLNCCLVYETFPELKHQMKHFFAFSVQFLMLQVCFKYYSQIDLEISYANKLISKVYDTKFLGIDNVAVYIVYSLSVKIHIEQITN